MKKLMIAITVSAVLLAGCGGSAPTPESSGAVPEAAEGKYDIDYDLITVQTKAGHVFENLTAHCSSTECTPDFLRAYYFNAYLPEANYAEDGTDVKAYLIFDDLTGKFPEEYGDCVGCELWTGFTDAYVYLRQKDNGLFETTGYFTSDWCSYVVDEEAGTFELFYTIDDLEDFEREYLRDI